METWLTVLASLIIFFAMFCPFATIPIGGDVAGWDRFGSVSWFPIALSIVAIVCSHLYRITLQRFCGVVVTVLAVWQAIAVHNGIADAKLKLSNQLSDNPFGSIAELAVFGAGVSWGAALLIIGGLGLIATTFIDL
ncbi:MAG: hypothetical protein R3289_19870 [Photobacterium sp.]|nr:hypothetical protein [Photobacterium sp.]